MRYRVPVLGLIGLLLAPGLVHATRTMPGVCDNAAPPIVSRFDFAESSSLDRPRFRIFQNIPLGARFRGVARSAGTLSVLVPAPDATGDLQGYEGRILVWTPDDPAQYLPAPYTLTVILNLTDPAGHPIHAPPSGLSYTHQGQSDIVWTKPPETPVLSASTAGNDRYLHGRPYLPDLGLYDYRARYYEPATGTFLELDPLGPVDSPNLYQAFGFDGLNVRDPFGECWLTGDNVPCSVYAREAAQTLFSPSPKAGVERAKATGKFLWHETKGAFRLGVGLMSFGLNAIKHPVQSFQAAGDALSGPSEALRTFLDHPGEVLEALPGDIQQAGYNLSVADVDEVAEHVGGGLAGVVAFEAGGRAISAMRGALAEETGALARSGLSATGVEFKGFTSQETSSVVLEANPQELRFSQRTAGGGQPPRAPLLREQMRLGWDPGKGPVDVIQTDAGLVTFDNTRVAIAQEYGFESVTVRVHRLDDPLPVGFARTRGLVARARRLGLPTPTTWGDALRIRTMQNRLPLEGTPTRPRMPN